MSELCNLNLEQYEDKYLRDVKRKGNRIDDVYVPKKARKVIEEYLATERRKDDKGAAKGKPLFLSG